MSHRLQLDDLRRAKDANDPELVPLLNRLLLQPEEPPETPYREDAPTFDKFLQQIRTPEFRKKPVEEQKQERIDRLKALEADDAEVPLPDRLRLYEPILELWAAGDLFSRSCLLQIIAEIPLVYGPWRALKRIYKEAEAAGDTEMLGALAARFDMAFASRQHGVSQDTLGYLVRRAWRFLRRTGETLPACYPDFAGDVLAHYTDDTNWWRTWIANHIFYHETREYGRRQFHFKSYRGDLLKHRAFAESWRRTPRPLFSLLERAKSEQVRAFATTALKTDFRATLREVEPAWVARLAGLGSATIDDFVVWILKNVPQFEQSKFRDVGLHDAVLRLFSSPSNSARKYAAEYARTHARDLPVEVLIKLIDNDSQAVSKLANDLLKERDPRKEVGLDAWGRLLETRAGYELAADVLRKHFTASEITPEWLLPLFRSESHQTIQFAQDRVLRLHSTKSLGAEFFLKIIEQSDPENWYSDEAVQFAMLQLEKLKPDELGDETLKTLLLHPQSRWSTCDWIESGTLKAESFPVEFLKTVAFHPDWEAADWVRDLKTKEWGKDLAFNVGLSERVLGWLGDVRKFLPSDLTFDWLMKLVQRSEPRYHDFAVETMTKVFLPADFAPPTEEPTKSDKKGKETEINVDLGGDTFLFTGKLATMSRAEAKGKVTAAGGANSSAVNAKLKYLVIGDEGSPLYGQGRKGSKQTKAEQMIADGAEMKIISETAFLQMLAGEQREFSGDQVQAGCERLWEMLTEPGAEDAPLRKFARRYFRRHHPEICLKETDRPVDPGAEIPPEFLTFEQVKPLFYEKRKMLRDFALEMAEWEFARWEPPIEGLVEMCEAPADEVREFVAKALTIEDLPENRRFRLNPDVLTADAVYSFCESRDAATRMLGMHLIERHPRLQLPEELFRLTESPDRRVRAFVIRSFWSLYRSRGITVDWKPQPPPKTNVGKAAKKKAEKAARDIGTGAPQRPDNPPATLTDLRDFLRRILFEIPPGRPDKPSGSTVSTTLKPLPTRKAKLYLVETLRDLAVEEAEFAECVLPLLEEFMGSFGPSEQAACVVAVTRIHDRHPEFAPQEGAAS